MADTCQNKDKGLDNLSKPNEMKKCNESCPQDLEKENVNDLNSVNNRHPHNVQGTQEYQNVREYAQAVQSWLWHYRMIQAFGLVQSQIMSSMHQSLSLHHHRSPSNVNTTNGHGQFHAQNVSTPLQQPQQGKTSL